MLRIEPPSPLTGSFEENCRALFASMANRGGRVGFTPILWFNGGLFDDAAVLPVDADDIAMLRKAAKMDWSQIDASLLGKLFERGLDPDKRSQLGAHYTDAGKIMQIVERVVLRPLKAEWETACVAIEVALDKEREANRLKTRESPRKSPPGSKFKEGWLGW